MYHPQLQTAAAPPPTFIEHYTALSGVLTDYGRRQNTTSIPVVPIQALRFDDQQELIWSGNINGHVTSYYSDQLTKYTSFSVGLDDPVLQLLTGDFGLLCLLKDELKLKNRRGIPKFSYNSSTFRDMICMSKLPSQLILLGGLAQNIIEFDLERKRQLRTTELDSKEVGCCLIRQHPKFICCADLEGRITLRNTNNLAVTHTFKTHTGQIADFDVHGNYLVTCGYPSSRPTPDRFLMVYDLRTYRLVTPIQTIFPPSLIRFIPAFTSKFCIASALGQFQLLDVAASAAENCTAFTHQVQLQPEASLTTMSVSSSGQALAFGDDLGLLHLFGANTNVVFNQYSAPTEFPDPLEAVPPIDVDDLLIPLSVVPTYPYHDMYDKPISQSDGLLDTPSNGLIYKTPKIDEKILESITFRQDVGYAPNPYKSEGPISYIKGQVGVVGMTTSADDTNSGEKSCADMIEFANDSGTLKDGDRNNVPVGNQ
uniref:PAB-dependent poly(A)-specific ribonuclease subunit 2 n=1 Tax=Aceria tosichella TaxID=561515 RepID=A0A6G1SQW0_9ACAR